MRGSLPEKALKGIEEQLSGACTTEIAAFDEFTALLTDDRDVIDHIPHASSIRRRPGHTIRLLKLPGAWTGLSGSWQGRCLLPGPAVGPGEAARRATRPPSTDSLTPPHPAHPGRPAGALSTRRVARTAQELAAIGITNQHLAINGKMPSELRGDPLRRGAAASRRGCDLAVMAPELAAASAAPIFPFVPAISSESRPSGSLLQAARTTQRPGHAPTLWASLRPCRRLGRLIDEIERPGKGLIMLMGKGGVGKTTIATAIAAELAARGHDVLLTTTDPAAHLIETLREQTAHPDREPHRSRRGDRAVSRACARNQGQ